MNSPFTRPVATILCSPHGRASTYWRIGPSTIWIACSKSNPCLAKFSSVLSSSHSNSIALLNTPNPAPEVPLMSDITLPRFPPPSAGREVLPAREYAALMRQNVLAAFSERAFTEEVLERRLFGRVQLTLNRPAAIRHVLIDNAENYARTSATRRLLYPIAGRGLLLAEGEEWRGQRR